MNIPFECPKNLTFINIKPEDWEKFIEATFEARNSIEEYLLEYDNPPNQSVICVEQFRWHTGVDLLPILECKVPYTILSAKDIRRLAVEWFDGRSVEQMEACIHRDEWLHILRSRESYLANELSYDADFLTLCAEDKDKAVFWLVDNKKCSYSVARDAWKRAKERGECCVEEDLSMEKLSEVVLAQKDTDTRPEWIEAKRLALMQKPEAKTDINTRRFFQ